MLTSTLLGLHPHILFYLPGWDPNFLSAIFFEYADLGDSAVHILAKIIKMKDHRRPKEEQYRTLSTVHEEDDSSSTDVDLEALDLSEKDYMHEATTSRARKDHEKSGFLAVLKEYWWLIDMFLLAVIIVLLLGSGWGSHGKDHFFEGAGDLTGFAPEFSQKVTKFAPDPGFVPENTSEFFSDETRQKWLDLVPSERYHQRGYFERLTNHLSRGSRLSTDKKSAGL